MRYIFGINSKEKEKYEKSLRKVMDEREYHGSTIDTVLTITELNPRAKKDMPEILKNAKTEREVIKAVQPYIKEHQRQFRYFNVGYIFHRVRE